MAATRLAIIKALNAASSLLPGAKASSSSINILTMSGRADPIIEDVVVTWLPVHIAQFLAL